VGFNPLLLMNHLMAESSIHLHAVIGERPPLWFRHWSMRRLT